MNARTIGEGKRDGRAAAVPSAVLPWRCCRVVLWPGMFVPWRCRFAYVASGRARSFLFSDLGSCTDPVFDELAPA